MPASSIVVPVEYSNTVPGSNSSGSWATKSAEFGAVMACSTWDPGE